jgi:hypothetical protein
MATTLTIQIEDAIRAAKIVFAGTSADGVTPVLTCAVWDDEAKRLASSDRYCLVTYELPSAIYEGDEEIMIPREILAWIGKLKHKDHFGASVRITMAARTVTAEVRYEEGDGVAFTTAGRIVGNFPPLMKLVEAWEPAEEAGVVGLGPELLKRLLTPIALLDKKRPIEFEQGKNSNPSKAGPVRITRGPVVLLVQPNTLVP